MDTIAVSALTLSIIAIGVSIYSIAYMVKKINDDLKK